MICFNQILPPKNQGGDWFESFHSMRFESYHLMSPKVFPLLIRLYSKMGDKDRWKSYLTQILLLNFLPLTRFKWVNGWNSS